MLIVLLLAVAVAAGAPPGAVAVLALAVFRPRWFLAGVVGWVVAVRLMRRRSRQSPDQEARFLQGVAAEVRAGASLRSALPAAATRAPDLALGRPLRLAGAGLPMGSVADELRSGLAVNGKLVAAAIRLSSATGASMAPLFARLSVRAAERGELARERKALTAQARLSAVVVGAAPILLVGMLWLSGRGATFFETGTVGLALGAVGLGLEAAGAAMVWLMIRRADV